MLTFSGHSMLVQVSDLGSTHCEDAQMAAYELGQLLPEDQRPLPLDFVRINDTRTDIVPNAGMHTLHLTVKACHMRC